MARRRWVQIDGKLVEVGTGTGGDAVATPRGPSILPDLPDFVSPIDGSVVRGRAGMREHCVRHDVVPTAELAGLPIKTTAPTNTYSKKYREETRQTIADIINSRNYK